MKFNYKSRKGFTLIELLVVIGILAVLVAIAIPSVAGLIDRANVSSDNTNANEMTNAIERFTSEYELYCQDVASGVLDVNDLDSAQGRIFNVTEIETRKGIEMTENLGYTHDIVGIDRDTKYPVNEVTAKKVIENFMKTSSSTFEPKQSDCSYYYSPQIGKVVVAKTGSTIAELNKIAMEDEAEYATINNGEIIEWINLSVNAGKEVNDWTYVNAATPTNHQYKELGTKAPTFNIEWSAKNETTGQPVIVGVSISNSNYSGNGTTPCTMTNVPMGKYALVATYAGNEYKFNLLVYQEGIQTFKFTVPGTNISVGSDNDTYVPSGNGGGSTPSTPSTPEPPVQSCQHNNTEIKNKTMTYTGDKVCKNCGTCIESGITLIAKELTIQGDVNRMTITYIDGWTWNDFINSEYNTFASVTLNYVYYTGTPFLFNPDGSIGSETLTDGPYPGTIVTGDMIIDDSLFYGYTMDMNGYNHLTSTGTHSQHRVTFDVSTGTFSKNCSICDITLTEDICPHSARQNHSDGSQTCLICDKHFD